MSQIKDREELAIRYLLGGLSEKERTTLEERFFADDGEFEELQIAEGELIDRYVRKELSATDQRQFEKMLRSSPRLAERVEFATILTRRLPSPDREKKHTWWNLFPTATLSPAMRLAPLAFVLLMGVALVLVWTQLRTQSGRLAAEQQRLQQLKTQIDEQRARSDKLEADLAQTNQQREAQDKLIADYEQQLAELRRQNPSSVFSFLLNPGSGTRGGGGSGEKTVQIPSGTQNVELRLNVEAGNYSVYQASLQSIDRKPIGPQQRRIKPVRRGGRKMLPLTVAAKLLPPGSYYVHVDGLSASGEPEDFNDYPFRVSSK